MAGESTRERVCCCTVTTDSTICCSSPDRTSVTVVDWQTITVGVPARDLASSLAPAWIPMPGKKQKSDLVGVYHRRLLDHGVTHYSASHCSKNSRIGMLQIPLLTTLGYAFAAVTDRGDEMVLAMLARGCRAIRDLGTIELINALI